MSLCNAAKIQLFPIIHKQAENTEQFRGGKGTTVRIYRRGVGQGSTRGRSTKENSSRKTTARKPATVHTINRKRHKTGRAQFISAQTDYRCEECIIFAAELPSNG